MKLRVTTICLAIVTATLVIACSADTANREGNTAAPASSPAASPPVAANPAVVEEVKEVLAKHDKALSDKNLDAVMETFSSDPNTSVLGTGSEEKWTGQQEIRAAYTEMFKDYDPGTMQATCDWKKGGADPSGNLAWFAAICNAKDSMGGKPRQYSLNVSAALAKQDGKWRFVMLHMSNAFQPPPAPSKG